MVEGGGVRWNGLITRCSKYQALEIPPYHELSLGYFFSHRWLGFPVVCSEAPDVRCLEWVCITRLYDTVHSGLRWIFGVWFVLDSRVEFIWGVCVLKNKIFGYGCIYLPAREVTSNHDQSLTQTTHRRQITEFSINSNCLTSSRTFTTENLKTNENTSEEKAQPILVV